jgi:ATP-binding cassette subfamily C protein
MNQLTKLYYLFDKKAKIRGAFLVVLMIIGSLLEAFSISVVLLFISLVNNSMNGSSGPSIPWLKIAYHYSGLNDHRKFLIYIGIIMIFAYIVKNIFLLFQIYSQNKFIYKQQAHVSINLLNSYLHSPYTFHLQRNTAELLRNITSSVDAIFGNGVNPVISILSELFVIMTISVLLFSVEPIVTLCALLIVGGLIFVFFRIVRNKLAYYGQRVQDLSTKIILWTNQSIGGVKEIKLMGRESFFSEIFSKYRFEYASNLTVCATIQKVPRLYLEVVLIGGILLIMVILVTRGDNAGNLIPIVALFAMASIRLMPSVSQVASSLNSLKFGKAAIDDIYDDVKSLESQRIEDNKTDDDNHLRLSSEIQLEDVTFVYPGTERPVLQNISLSIKKGSAVAFVGPSGAGKTTIIDIILGLLEPTEGKIKIDNKDIHSDRNLLKGWQSNIGYIPQDIYLIDDSLRRNIAFGMADEEIDDGRIIEVIGKAHLNDFLEDLPQGLDTTIGERGMCLSGGQCQRIGIARALYHNPKVLVMDEATSSLDNQTESDISQAIDEMSGEKTVMIIAHRLSTVKKCEMIFFIKEGRLMDYGKLNELLERNEDFRQMAQYSTSDPI